MWLRWHDRADQDPLILHISRNQSEVHRHLGILACLMLYCSSQGTNGFVPELVARQHLRSKRLLALFTTPPGGAVPLLHRPGDDCDCLEGRTWPATAADYYVHHYLKWNPTKEEYDVAAAKKAELRDQELLTAVRNRDHGRCRYCGTECGRYDRVGARGLVYDHVDPTIAAGAANLVVACRSCNSKKGNRTPEAAGLVLLPVPDPVPTQRATNGSEPAATTSRARTGRDGTGNRPTAGDAGPNGHRDQIGPTVPRTDSRHPDPYLRTTITGLRPEHHAGLPDLGDHPTDLPPTRRTPATDQEDDPPPGGG